MNNPATPVNHTMRAISILSLSLALAGTSAQAQLQYTERIENPTGAGIGVSAPHANAMTYDLGQLFYLNTGGTLAPGNAAITFASTPAPYVRAQARHTSFGTVIVSGYMGYQFAYSGPANTYVPIDFTAMFDVQNGYRAFNRSEVVFSASGRTESTGGRISCEQICLAQPALNSGPVQSTVNIAMSASVDAALGSSAAVGSFSGRLMGLTNAQGQGTGSIYLYAFASALNTVPSWAFIDPELHIDAGFLAAHPEASLTLPVGVGNAVTAVPEPAAPLLMAVGLAAVLGLRRRSRQGARV